MFDAVFIDIDNTLLSFDGYVKQTMKEGFASFGLCEYNDGMFDVFKSINDSFWHRIEDGTLTFEELLKIRWNTIFKALGIECDGVEFEKFFRSRIFTSAIPMDSAFVLLDHLKGRYVLCAASNGPCEQQVNRLKSGGMFEYFDHFFISEDIGFQKPSKKFFDECFRRLNAGRSVKISPSETLMIGDSLTSDIRGGKNCGMKTCFYNFRSLPVPDDVKPDYCVTDLKEILLIT